jgi:TPR repeat protein
MIARPLILAVVAAQMLTGSAFAQSAKPAPKTPPAKVQKEQPAKSDANLDLAFGAFQRGYYLTAFNEATKRVDEQKDPKAMTLLAELYANGFGVKQDDAKAAEWYKLAADRGDREAMFALAMFRIGGRGGPRSREDAAKLLASAAKLGHVAAAYDLALLYIEGTQFPQDFGRAAELLRQAADAGSPEAQYALATFYKDGRGCAHQLRRLAGNIEAQTEYAIALYNGTGVAKDEVAAAQLLLKAARRGSPIAQNRLARVLASGRGLPADPVEAVKWHMISKAGGATDHYLDEFAQKQPPSIREAAEKAAKPWLTMLTASRS